MHRLISLALLLSLLGAAPAAALESAPASDARGTVALVSDSDAVAPGKSFRIGLYFHLAPGWHTYWRNPGDAGVAPSLDLTLPAGAAAGPIQWPTPRRIAEGPVMTYAYTGDVLLPVNVTPPATASPGPLVIQARARWLACKDICVPEEATFRLDLPFGTPSPSARASLFSAHDRAMPRPSPWQATLSPEGSLWVRGPELRPATVTDAWFIPDHPGLIQDDGAQPVSVRDGGLVLALKLPKGAHPDILSGILAVRDRSGLETDVTLHASAGAPPPPAFPSLWQMLLFAILGGLILNLMPCVFPILAMKAMALAQGAVRGEARTHAVFYTAGVLATFAGLAGVHLAARAAGAAVGWGFQLSSPVFVAAMAWLLFGVGLNLSGVLEFGGGLTGTGNALAARGGRLGSFFTGLLAVLVATPCTAPFMGVAVAAGLAAPPAEAVLVFLAMGLGLAAPYAAFSMVPALARLAPRPGAWMQRLKQGLAFPMYGAAVWLLWVVSQEAGPSGVMGTAAGFVLLGFAAWVLGISQQAPTRSRRLGQSAAAAALVLAAAVLSSIAVAPGKPAAAGTVEDAEAFSPARLATLRAAGRPVFVNMTAAWCVTCLVNERVALATAAVQRAFALHNVAYLTGDWTRQDPVISDFLREHGRAGVPLYVYFPPHDGTPVVLPQILTENEVLRELNPG